jgi:hypothetical protein
MGHCFICITSLVNRNNNKLSILIDYPKPYAYLEKVEKLLNLEKYKTLNEYI